MAKTLSLVCLTAGALVCAASPAFAQDKATIDLLEKKGLITRAEHDQILAGKLNQSLTLKNPDTTQFTIFGYVQSQYNFLHVRGGTLDPDPADNNQFEIRRALINFSAKSTGDWGAYITIVSDATYRTRDFLENAAVTYNVPDYGMATAGYRKVKFAMEEVSAATDLPAIERSIVTNYFTTGSARGGATIADRRLGFANRHVGLYWDGKTCTGEKGDIFEYGAAVTNGYTDSVQFASADNNAPSVWAGVQQTLKYSDDTVLSAGVNFGWSPSNDIAAVAGENADTIGYNPFLKAKLGDFAACAEFIGAWVNNGRADSDADALPWGTNLTATYRFGAFEPALRLAYLDTDGRGTPLAVWRWNSTPNEGLYDKAWTFYAGVNFYMMNDSIKISAGYEHGRFSGTPASGAVAYAATGDGVRVQVQAIF